MKKFTWILLLVLVSGFSHAQSQNVPEAGKFGGAEKQVVYKNQAGYSLQHMINNGHYQMRALIDYDSLNMSFLGNWPSGINYSLIYSGIDNIFMLGSGGTMIVLDLSDPEQPETISEVRSRSLVDCAFFDTETNRLYLGAYFSGVEIWDLNDMQHPFRLARIPTESYPRGGVFAEGNIVYVMTVAAGIYIYDIENLEDINLIGHYPIPSSSLVWNSAKDGDLMFCAAGNACRIVDVSDPSNLVMAGVIAGASAGVYAENGKFYQLSSTSGLKIWDVSNPATPQLLGQIAISGNPAKISVNGDYAYITSAANEPNGGLKIIDVSDPTNPQEKSSFVCYTEHVATNGSLTLISAGSECKVIDVTDINSPQLKSTISLPGWVHNVFLKGNYGYTGSNGFRVFDLSDKSNPVQVGFNETLGAFVATNSDYAVYIPYSAGGNNKVNIMDISDPTSPKKMGHYVSPAMTYKVDLKDNYAFIACWWDGVRVINFSNPESPVLAAHVLGWYNGAIPGDEYCFAQSIDVVGDYLYVIDYMPFEYQDTKGIYIFNISDPANPVFINRFKEFNSKCNDISVQDDYAYLADNVGGVEVINIADPNNPFVVGYVYLPDVAEAITTEGKYAYVSNYILGGVQMLDISFPPNSNIAGYYKRSGVFALGVSVQGSHVYIGDGIAGFQIYDNLFITSVEDLNKNNSEQLDIYPNPALQSAKANFITTTNSYCNLSIYDLTGRKVQEIFNGWLDAGEQTFEIKSNQLKAGIYFVKLEINDQVRTSKLVISH